ncbi:MAG TPA: 50S ribosomal protein L10 [Armatimonadetes bacterium]|nr:50S ribosomal protein L10 [Armatimonadota bacterium]HCM74281.1 50S ribosomal protein L10 [Armatimonadota bacterium]HRD30311.1 50S ribosomal protein L10 [Fimbriimonadaceae bacterium]HRE94041.1 50S ribosomal protein L10 [Fimbriimonadaceae bacterium]
MPTAAKAQVIDQTKEKFEQATGVFLTEYRGLTVQDMQNLRASLREKGGELKVIKNTLFRKALGETADALTEELGSGPTAFAFVYENETDCAKILVDYTKTNKAFVVKGGLLNGKIMDAQAVENFSKLPPRDQLIAMVIGAVAAPLSTLVGTVEAIYAQPIRVIGAVADKVAEGGGPVAAESAPSAPASEEAPTPEETSETE